ncbi:hypothetical protein POM88_051492 [Heracleum sosnowskyi]|uniref:DNA topoisomerase VI subunit B transducer domain-containing protein n=1 Tax=Heracleum sosnowskyi TaxID=360622 RepID=A0AAD8H0J8_9APIA|nr:hypothetical protein POM88_051492 [Heracleum sosnowskyi]
MKIPFKGTGKEYIGDDDTSEVASAVKTSIQQRCIELKSKIVKKFMRTKSASHFFLGSYIPDATGAMYDVLKEMATLQVSKKKCYNCEDAELLKKVSSRLK